MNDVVILQQILENFVLKLSGNVSEVCAMITMVSVWRFANIEE